MLEHQIRNFVTKHFEPIDSPGPLLQLSGAMSDDTKNLLYERTVLSDLTIPRIHELLDNDRHYGVNL